MCLLSHKGQGTVFSSVELLFSFETGLRPRFGNLSAITRGKRTTKAVDVFFPA